MRKRRENVGRETHARDDAGRGASSRATDRRAMNRQLLIYLLLPTIFLTVALLGGLRVDFETRAVLFVPPPLTTLLLAALLLSSFARGRLVNFGAWLSGEHAPQALVAHALTLLALFFASAQAFNSVLPEAGLPRWLFSFFFLWTLWQNQFASLDARRTLRGLAALFATAFVLKHLILAGIYAPDGGWLKRVAGALVEGLTQGTVGERQSFAPSTGYVSFFALALYVAGLALLPAAPEDGHADQDDAGRTHATDVIDDYRRLDARERSFVRQALSLDAARRLEAATGESISERDEAATGSRVYETEEDENDAGEDDAAE